MTRPTCVALLLVAVGACAPAGGGAAAPLPSADPCAARTAPMIRVTLFLGRSIPTGGEVSDSAWDAFLANEVVPRFPGGFTVVDANGHWRGAADSVVRERTKLLMFLHPPAPAADSAVRGISDAYRRRFAQEAVLREVTFACVAFDR